MDSFAVFDGVMEYLESVVAGADAIDYDAVARKAGCPAPLFQRIFVYVTGVNMAEYVRRRRLTLAGLAVREGREKVIDIALQYGFNSHAAFTRAFREHHGVSPSQMRSTGTRPVDYPRISFTDIRIVGEKNYGRNEKNRVCAGRRAQGRGPDEGDVLPECRQGLLGRGVRKRTL